MLAWRAGGRLLIGRERIALLESVMEHKSITKAAEVMGFSYKTAWDAVNAINNLRAAPSVYHTHRRLAWRRRRSDRRRAALDFGLPPS